VPEGQPLTITLSGSDPDGDALTYTATELPPGATLNSPFTWTPDFDQAGTYTVTFTASDGSLTDSETVDITVTNTNRPPTASAGADLSVTLPDAATLNGTATDPDGQSLTATWTKVSGPGTVTFGDASAVDTTSTFSAAGSYVLRLTVSDGSLADSDDVSVAVEGIPPTPQALITDVSVVTGRPLVTDRVAIGGRVYIDRSYTFRSVPSAYLGHEFIRTANDDKNVNTNPYMTFTLTAPATVYVAFDARSTQLPLWLTKSRWAATGETLVTSDTSFKLYKSSYSAGQVTLGSNNMWYQRGAQSHYIVIAVPK